MGAPTADAPIITKKKVRIRKMKKLLSFLMAFAAVAMVFVSCRKVVRAEATGQVDEITDSMMVVKIDGSKVVFDILECAFTNGAVMYGDSVVIRYVGDLDEKRAVAETCYLIVKPSEVVEIVPGVIDSTKELKTRPADDKELQNIKRLIKTVKKHQKK